jgi:hypothetical protein
MTQKPSVGDKYKCTCDDLEPIRRGDIVTVVDVRTCDYEDLYVEFEDDLVWCASKYPTDFKYVEPEKQLPFKGKCFINVKSYAEKYGILMDKAHEEIQPKLFELGYSWYKGKDIIKFGECLDLSYQKEGEITHSQESFEDHLEMKELLIERKEIVTVDISATEPTIEYVEFNGKQYDKAKLERALKMIDESNLS